MSRDDGQSAESALRTAASAYADELNQLDLRHYGEWLADVAVETPFWDERTNLWSMAGGDDPLQSGLVLSDGQDEIVICHDGTRWVVDEDFTDWDSLEDLVISDQDP